MKPIFKNRPNSVHKIDGKEVWESRSVAVIGVILAINDNKSYVLGERRAESMCDEPGKWCLPCGYIDWDESGWDALRREVYEETGFYIDKYKKYLIDNNDQEPFFVMTHPSENRQNVGLSYYSVFNFPVDKFPKEVENFKDSEIAEIKWILTADISKYVWAFSHDERIKMVFTKISR